jgi:hypothetical protein
MADLKPTLKELHTALGYQPLNRAWAKAEILVGLTAVGLGLLLGGWIVARAAELEWGFILAALALFVFGGYLAMAGHRSHLYQSNNELTVYLIDEIRRSKGKADPQ